MRPSRSSKSIAFISCSSRLVELVDVGDGLLEVGADELAVAAGVAQLVLGVRDLVLDRRRREALGVDAELVDAALDEPAAVGLVVDRVLARVAEARRLGAQHPRAGAVEGHHPHRPRRVAEQQLDALAHLLRGLVGERDREDLAGPRDAGLDEPRDAVREHPRLARPGAREHEQRPLAVRDGGALGLVQAREQVLDSLVCGDVGHRPSRIGAGAAGAAARRTRRVSRRG